MRLLRRDQDGVLSFVKANERYFTVPYAILSHTWDEPQHEVLYQHIRDGSAKEKACFSKIQFMLNQAERDGLHHVWIDTCCIDRENKVELGEAINSMFRWYDRSAVCYALLTDVSGDKSADLKNSRWFSRGWTLQELVAPRNLCFYNQRGMEIGERTNMADVLSDITGIRKEILLGAPIQRVPIAERYRWSHDRKTTKMEDKTYCMLGILDVHLRLDYGLEAYNADNLLMKAIAETHGQSAVDDIMKTEAEISMEHELLSASTYKDALMLKLHFPEARLRRTQIQPKFSGTCAWLLKHPLYKRWKDTTEQYGNPLWIQGHPGAGKTTLMKHLDDESRNEFEQGIRAISFYFNAEGLFLERSSVGMYRSLLLQLLAFVPSSALEEYMRYEETRGRIEDYQLDVPTLKETFRDLLRRCRDLQIRCFVDAVDVCDPEEAEDMTAFFYGLMHSSSQCQFVVCFASRYFPALSTEDGIRIRLEEQVQHQQDLDTYVNAKLTLGLFHGANGIRQRLLANSNGIFMWTRLAVSSVNRIISRGAMSEIHSTIDRIPNEFSELITSITKHENTHSLSTLQVCIPLILCGSRSVTCEEFYDAVTFVTSDKRHAVSSIAADDLQMRSRVLQSFVANASRGLAEQFISTVDAADSCGEVQFMHESLRDHFLQRGGLQQLFPTISEVGLSWCHDKIKVYCYNYLETYNSQIMQFLSAYLSESNESGPSLSAAAATACITKFPFLRYAAERLTYHAEHAAEKIPQGKFVETLHHGVRSGRLDCFVRFRDRGVENMWFEQRPDEIASGVRAVHLLAADNCHRLMATAAGIGLDVDLKFGILDLPPLLIAMYHSAWLVVQQLIIYGSRIDIFMNGFEIGYGDLLQYDRLGRISNELHHVRLLEGSRPRTRRGIKFDGDIVEVTDPSGRLGAILQMFILYGVCIDSKSSTGCTPLLLSLSWEHYEDEQAMFDNVKWLLEHGASTTASEWNGRSAIGVACANNQTPAEVFTLLLDNGAPISNTSGEHSIVTACQFANLTAVDVLLKRPTQPKLSQSDGRQALWTLIAATRCSSGCDGPTCKHAETLQLLLAHGVDTEITNAIHMTPYMVAAQGQNKCSQSVAALLSHWQPDLAATVGGARIGS